MDECGIGEIVGPRISEPLNGKIPSDQFIAKRAERLDIERYGIAPEIEKVDALLAVCTLDFIDNRLDPNTGTVLAAGRSIMTVFFHRDFIVE